MLTYGYLGYNNFYIYLSLVLRFWCVFIVNVFSTLLPFIVIFDHHALCLGFSVMIQDLLDLGWFSYWECLDLAISWRKSSKLFYCNRRLILDGFVVSLKPGWSFKFDELVFLDRIVSFLWRKHVNPLPKTILIRITQCSLELHLSFIDFYFYISVCLRASVNGTGLNLKSMAIGYD